MRSVAPSWEAEKVSSQTEGSRPDSIDLCDARVCPEVDRQSVNTTARVAKASRRGMRGEPFRCAPRRSPRRVSRDTRMTPLTGGPPLLAGAPARHPARAGPSNAHAAIPAAAVHAQFDFTAR